MPGSATAAFARLVARFIFATAVFLGIPVYAAAQTTRLVASDADLRTALAAAVSGDTIRFTDNITLTANLPGFTAAITIDGGGFALSGNDLYRGFVVGNGATNTSVTIQNLTIQNTLVTGGPGQAGAGGGGGAAGLGGALYVAQRATVTVHDVQLLSNSAIGGAGGAGGVGANGGTGGGDPGNRGFGGSSLPGFIHYGGQAGTFGGGGGAASWPATGGASGGGGGEYGGGGGATNNTSALSRVGGGAGATGAAGGGGGGGAGAGGAVFVQWGGTLVITGAFTVDSNAAIGGAAGTGASPGGGLGAGIFLDPRGTVGPGTLSISTDSTVTINDSIGDRLGAGGTAGTWSPSYVVSKAGTGTLVLAGTNAYTGGTTLGAGVLSVSRDANLGATTGRLTVSNGATLQITGTDSQTFARNLFMTGGTATVDVAPGKTVTWTGPVSDQLPGTLQLTGGGVFALTNAGNSYRGGTTVTGGTTLGVGADGALGNAAGGLTLGDALTGGTLSFSSAGFASSRAVTLGAAGGTIDTAGFDATLVGVTGGAGGFTKIGLGTLTFGNAGNTYSGGTAVNAGALRAGATNIFGASPALTIGPSGAVDFDVFGQTLDTLSGSGSLALSGAASSLAIGGTNASSTFTGTISGAGGVLKVGSGTLTLGGTNTFTGGIALQGGTLQASSDANLGGAGGAVTMSDSTTLDVTGGGTYVHPLAVAGTSTINTAAGQSVTWSGQITDNGVAGALRLTGGGAFVLANTANSYSGGTVVSGGTLRAGAANVFGANPALTIGSSGAVDLDVFGQSLDSLSGSGSLALTGAASSLTIGGTNASSTFTGVISGAGSLVKVGSGTLTLGGANTFTGGTALQGGTLRVSSDANIGAAGASLAMSGATTLDLTSGGTYTHALGVAGTSTLNGVAGQSVTWSGRIDDNGGAGTLRLTGGGTFALTNTSNSYSGGTAVSGGSTLNVVTDSVLGAPGAGLTLGDATTRGILNLAASGIVLSRPITLGAAGGAISTAGGTTAAVSGAIGGAGGLTKTGAGTLVFSGANTFAGGLTLQAGTLRIGSATSLTGGVAMGDATVLDLAGGTYTGSLAIGGTGSIVAGAGQSATWTGQIGDNGSVPGTLRVTGAGTFAATNTGNAYSGGTIVTGGGTLNAGADAVLGAPGAGVTLGDAATTGTLGLTTSGMVFARSIALGATGGAISTPGGTTATVSGTLGGSGGLTKIGSGALTLSGSNTFSGGVVLNAGTLRVSSEANLGAADTVSMSDGTTLGLLTSGTFGDRLSLNGVSSVDVTAGQSATWTGQIGGSGALQVTGAGTLVPTNATNSYSGGTVVTGGSTVKISTDAALGGAGGGIVLGDATSVGTLAINPTDTHFLSARAIALGGAGGAIDVAGATTATLSGVISGSGALTKSGDGTLWLTGASTYTGGTFLRGGSLVTNATSLSGSVFTDSGLVFHQPIDGTFRGFIDGAGGLTKQGAGTLTLNGLHGYTGLTWVREGSLFVDAGLPGSVLVDPGATLQAAGVIGGSLTVGGSLLVPPSSLPAATFNRTWFGAHATTGTRALGQVPSLVVNGDLTMNPGSTFSFWLSPDIVAPVVVNGVATLNGTHVLVDVNDPNPKRVATYLGIAAAGGLKVIGGDVSSPSPLLVPVLNPQANALTVTVVNLGVPLSTPVPAAFDPRAATGDFKRVMTELWALDDGNLGPALRSLSGEIHASEQRMVVLDSLAMTDMIRNEISTQDAEERQATGALRPWFGVGADHVSFDGGAARTSGSGGGFDVKPAPAWTLGGGGALSLGDLSLSGVSGASEMTSPRAFFYSGFSFGPFAVHWGGSRAWTTTSTSRAIEFVAYVPDASGRPVPLFPGTASGSSDRPGGGGGDSALPRPGVNRQATAQERSTASDAWSEWQFARKVNTWKVDAKLGLRVARFSREGFSETGADSISLNGLDQTLKSNQANFDFHLVRLQGTWRPNVFVTYRREFGDDFTSANVDFAGNPGSPFAVRGFAMPANVFQGVFAITMRSMAGLLYTLEYHTLQSSEESRHGLRFKVRFW